jgi:ArsR family transcriptional regulator, arsenate/arsenite/antimonite-responsive transcriptional repressor
MPMYHEDAPNGAPRIGVHASVAVELDWVLGAALRPDFRIDHPDLDALYSEFPDLAERASQLWSDVPLSCGGFMELEIIAHHGGLLFSADGDALVGRLAELCATVPVDYELASETDEDRAVLLERLRRLHDSADLRSRYVALIADVWAAVQGTWDGRGRHAVEAALAGRRDQVARGAPWEEVARSECHGFPIAPRLVARLGPDDEVAVVPAYFTHKGLIFDLPGVVVIGVRADATGAQARSRTAQLARRLKTISDPTRLAILDALRSGPRTVSELATTFSLAQPTVSNHVKLLRDAGLIANASDRGRRELVVQHDVVVDLLAHLHHVLTGDLPPDSVSGSPA